ncbi:DUF2752 domain-containing protein [Nocardioides sp.]|nr:DUF2752 domain-containing protein [Nocardioides sp.]
MTTPRLASTEVLAAGGVVALAAACLLSPEQIEDGPVLCPFRRLTGLPCPGCGLTRSWVYLVHGWWRESFLAHPFGPLAVALVVVLALLAVRARLRRTAAPSLDRIVTHPAGIVVAVAWLGFAVIRMAAAA